MASMQADDQQKGYRYQDTTTDESRFLTFTQVLLRSSAIEEIFACIVCSPKLRSELMTAWGSVRDDSPDASPSSGRTHANSEVTEAQLGCSTLYQFLRRTMTGDEAVWFDIVSILFSPHGHDDTEMPQDIGEEDVKIRERSNSSADWFARCERKGFRATEMALISSLKKDWFDDWLEVERRDLAATVDIKKNQLLQRTTSPGPSQAFADPNGPMWQKVKLSGELVDLYESVKDNLDSCTMHRSETRKEILTVLEEKNKLVETGKETARVDQQSSAQRQVVIKENAKSTEAEFQPKLKSVLDDRTVVDGQIASLEEEKRRLKMELEKVSGQLVAAQTAQRKCMESEQGLRTEMGVNRDKFASMLLAEVREEGESKIDFEIRTRCVLAIRNAKERIESLYRMTGSELNDIYTQFDNAFVEAVQDHMTVMCESIQEIYRRVKRLADEMEAVKRTKNSQSMSEMMHSALNEYEKEEFSASVERLAMKILEIETKLKNERAEVDRFDAIVAAFFKRFESKLTSNRLLKGEVDKVNVVFAETERILTKYSLEKKAPVVAADTQQLVVEEEPDSPANPETEGDPGNQNN